MLLSQAQPPAVLMSPRSKQPDSSSATLTATAWVGARHSEYALAFTRPPPLLCCLNPFSRTLVCVPPSPSLWSHPSRCPLTSTAAPRVSSCVHIRFWPRYTHAITARSGSPFSTHPPQEIRSLGRCPTWFVLVTHDLPQPLGQELQHLVGHAYKHGVTSSTHLYLSVKALNPLRH